MAISQSSQAITQQKKTPLYLAWEKIGDSIFKAGLNEDLDSQQDYLDLQGCIVWYELHHKIDQEHGHENENEPKPEQGHEHEHEHGHGHVIDREDVLQKLDAIEEALPRVKVLFPSQPPLQDAFANFQKTLEEARLLL